MEFKLSVNELLFLSAALKIQNLYAFEYDNLNNDLNIDIDENIVEGIKKELENKGYIKIINKDQIDMDEDFYNTLLLWANPEYIITRFDYNSEDLTPNGFLFIDGEKMLNMEKIWGVYFLKVISDKENINNYLVNMLKIKNNIEDKENYNISMTANKLENILKLYSNDNKDELTKELNKIGLSYDEGIKMLNKINDNSCNFISVEKHRENKGTLIKIKTDNNENYLFKYKKNMISDRVVIAKQQANEIINTLFVV